MDRVAKRNQHREFSLEHRLDAPIELHVGGDGEPKFKAGGDGVVERIILGVAVN